MKKFFLLLISLACLLGLGACAGTRTLAYHQWIPTGEMMQQTTPVAPAPAAPPAPAPVKK